MDSEICNVKFQTLPLTPEYCKISVFSSVSSKQVPFAVSFVPRALWFLLILSVFMKQDKKQTSKKKRNTLETLLRAFSIPCSSTRTFISVSETLGPCPASPARSAMWLKSNQTLLLLWSETFFTRGKHCTCRPRCRHFYKSEFRSHSSLAHFIICIFLLYRLNIFYVNSWFSPPPPPVNSIEAPNSWWWINCPSSPLV